MIVWNTTNNMRTLDTSIGTFFRDLEEKIAGEDGWRFVNPAEVDSLWTPNAWCCYASYVRYSLRRVPRGEGQYRQPANLTIGIELWREVADHDHAWQYAKQPLIYVGYCPSRNDWWDKSMACDHQGVPAHYSDGEVSPPTRDAPYLWTWNRDDGGRWSCRNWFFVLPMFSINDGDGIQQEIIEPLRSLIIDDSDVNEAFEGTNVIQTSPEGR